MSNILVFGVFTLRFFTLIIASLILKRAIEKHNQINLSSSKISYAYLLFGTGIMVFALGDILEEILFELTSVKLQFLHMIEAILNIAGFLLIIRSIYES